MNAPDVYHGYALEPLAGGGWRLLLYVSTEGGRQVPQKTVDFPADHRTDPTGEAAYEQALREAEAWRRQSPALDRRTDPDLRNALVRLRLAEFRAAEYLPTDQMQEMTATIDSLVQVLRDSGNLPQTDRAAANPDAVDSLILWPSARRWPTLTLREEHAP